MIGLDSRFSRPSSSVFGMGALGVLSVGLISGGLWFDSHRSAEAVERAQQQVSAAQNSQRIPEPVAATSERAAARPSAAERSTESGDAGASAEEAAPAERSVEAQQPAEVRYGTPATSVPTAVAARRPPVVPARPAHAAPGVPAAPELEVTHPGEAGFAPPPHLPDLLLPFLPQVNPAPQADPAPQETTVVGEALDRAPGAPLDAETDPVAG